MKTCIRCKGKLSSAARCAGSKVCTACAVESGELSAVPLLSIMELRTGEDRYRLIERMNG